MNLHRHKLSLSCFRLLLALLFSLPTSFSIAQDIQFERIPNELGLSQNLISALWQDRQGFIWVGTKDGLNRFDGYRFRVFQHDPFDSTSISDNTINCILEDRRGRLWIGTANGLNLMDRKSETFQRFFPKGTIGGRAAAIVERHPGLSGRNINSLLEDREGNIWVGTMQSGVVKMELPPGDLSPAQIKFTVFRATDEENSLWKNPIKKMVGDEEGAIWVHTRSHICLIQRGGASGKYDIKRLNWEDVNPQWQGYRQEDFTYTDLGTTQVDRRFYSIFSDRNGAVWLTMAGGFAKWRPRQKDFALYPLDVNLADYPVPPLMGAEGVNGLIDRMGRIWIDGLQTLVVYDTASHKIVAQFHREATGTPDFFLAGFQSLLEDASGNIWVGTNGNGLYQYFPHKKRFSGQQDAMLWEGESLRAIYQTSDGTVWMGTASRKLLRMDWQTQKTEAIILDKAKWPRTFDSEIDQIFAMEEDREGNLWVAASRGLFRFRSQGGKLADWKFFKIYEGEDFFPNVFDVHIDGEGGIWLLTHFEFGRFDPVTGKFDGHDYLGVSGGQKEMGSNFPCIFQQKNGLFWLGIKKGLLRFEAGTSRFTFFTNDPKNPNSLSHPHVKCIQAGPAEPERVLWIGTGGGGLNRFDVETGRFTHFKKSDGLPDNVVYAIFSDEAGNLWMSTNQGLSKFNPGTGSFKNYGAEDGLQDNEFNSGAYFKSKNGRLFFGGIGGFNAFLPSVVKDNEFVPPIAITDFKLANQSVDFKAADSPLKTAISQTQELVLTWEHNIFSFEFASLDFTEPGKNQYAYKLEGFDDEWQYIGTQRTATFTNISPGEYTFRVKGSNHDGTWNEAGTSLKITILPPWWKTWWAYSTYFFMIVGAAYAFYKSQLKRQMEKAETRRLSELDSLKTRLYTNITHEFRTPLTVIMGMNDNIPGAENERRLIRRNSENLLRLVNQLLDLSKIDSGSMKMDMVQGEVINYLSYLTESFHSMAQEKNIDLTFQTEEPELHMDFDEVKLQHIIYNLLSNAIKFTPKRGEITLVTRQVIDNGQPNLYLAVQDNGIGIPGAQLPQIFDRFFQADSTTTRKGGGTGIGLALTKELVGMMGGSISVESEEKKGTVFTLLLPINREAGTPIFETEFAEPKSHSTKPRASDQPAEAAEKPEPPALESDKPLLLIIEDNKDVIAYTKSILKKDYRIETAMDGQAGIDKALEIIPDIIITDVMMPEKDGFEVCQTLKSDERSSHIPIVMLTAKAADEDRITGLKTGADAYLMKPFNKEELLIRLEKLIELRRTLQERYREDTTWLRPTSKKSMTSAEREFNKEDEFLKKLREAVEANMGNSHFDIPELCKAVFLGHTQVYRKLKALTGKTPSQFIRRIRLQKGLELLQTTDLTISDIAYDIGFSDPAYFSRTFSKEFGKSPSDVRN